MAMVVADLADALKVGLGFGAEPTSSETIGMATAIINELGVGIVAHLIGEITGTAPSPSGPTLSDGAATGGLITGMTGASLADKMKTEMGKSSVSSELLDMATEIADHLSTATIEFAAGDITGICAHTPTVPGPLVGEGTGGTLQGLSGPTLASALAGVFGSLSPELSDLCNALIDYISNNAEVTYSTGSVTGTCPAGGGSILLGAGVGGSIS